MSNLHLGPGLVLPLEAVTQKLGFIGTTGSGKTYGAMRLAEEMLYQGAQVIVLDPVGVWWGLRLDSGGKRPSDFKIPIFGGLHGDVPLESTAGALMANVAVDRGTSMILDVSQFESDAQKARFGCDFADRFFFRKKAAPSAVHLFIEECQEFVPQNPQREEARMLHAFTRLQKLGRNFGIGSTYITQRPQEVNKKALNMVQTLFVLRCSGSQERQAIERWVRDKDLEAGFVDELPKLKTGTCHVWSPEFLKISGSEMTVRAISQRATFDASATPLVGQTAAKNRALGSIDLEKIKADMAATIERARAEDPAALRQRIRELEKELKAKPPVASMPAPKKVEVPVLKEAEIKRLERTVDKLRADLVLAINTIAGITEVIKGAQVRGERLTKANEQIAESTLLRQNLAFKASVATADMSGRREHSMTANGTLGKCERAILSAMAQMGAPATKAKIAVWSGYSMNSGSFTNALSKLRTLQLVEGYKEMKASQHLFE